MGAFKRIKLGQALTFQRGFDITKAEQTPGPIPIVSSSGISSYHNVAKKQPPGVIIGRKGNREIAALIRDGAPVEYDDARGRKQHTRVRFIDFEAPEQNTYTAVTQLWIQGTGPAGRFRRPDILLFVNGIPLVFIELKNSNVNVQDAYTKNLTDYKEDIPQLFHANAVCILSNAIETRVGSMTATWEYFFQWLRVDDEKEKVDRKKIAADTDSLPRVIDGLLAPPRLLDYVENFTLFYKESQKIIAQNHQFIGVNNAYDRFNRREETPGKLGVGDYVSEYNFRQAIDDESTVPLYHQKRVPEVLIQNDDLTEDLIQIFEEEEVDELQQEKLENRFAKETEVIRRDDRLDTIAQDIVEHFPTRGYLGKAMVITLDKFTAVSMYDKVQHHWKEKRKAIQKQIATADASEKALLKKQLDWMKRVEMAVVVSHEADEEKKFQKRGLDIKPHRERMEKIDKEGHDVEYNFKDPDHPLQLVFVCAMWLTGFDAPTVSTLYLDKPMRDHSLMQTIARANRVTSHKIDGATKTHGEIIDYYNVFRNLQRALRDYGEGDDGTDMPVQEKGVLFDLLDQAIDEAAKFCEERGMPLDELSRASGQVFKSVSLFGDYADKLLGNEEWRKSFYVYENTVSSLYSACKPEILGQPVVRRVAVFQYLRGVVDALVDGQDVSEVEQKIAEMLDESVVVDESAREVVKEPKEQWKIIQKGRVWDLSKTNFEALKHDFKKVEHKNIEIADLLAFIKKKLDEMMSKNVSRRDFAERLQSIVDRYNSGSSSSDNYYDELVNFAESMKDEDERHVREGLTEDELEIFDLIKNDKMTEAETQKVKLAAKALLKRVLQEHPRVLIEDWFRESQTRQLVKDALGEVLDATLPDSYDKELFQRKRDDVFEVILDYALSGLKFAA